MQLQGTTALITGATGGIGQSIARELAARGSRLTLTARNTRLLDPLAEELSATAYACDLSDRDGLARLAADCVDVDILVANAGIPGSGTYNDLSDQDVDLVLDVNLRAPIVLAHALGRRMAERGRGHMVFISSLSGLVATSRTSMYNATKFGLRGFAHALRLDMAGTGVGVSVVLPGFIREAGMFAEAGVDLPPFARTKSPRDVAEGVVEAIEKDRGEVLVAPTELKLGARFGGLAPRLSSLAQSSSIARRASASLAEAQKDMK